MLPYITVTRIRRHMILDAYSGEETLGSWGDAEEKQIKRCLFGPGTSEEFPNVELEQLSSLATLHMPYRADVNADDRIRVDGALWSVEGRRADWPGSMVSGSVVNLKYIREDS